jgi:hypothetical protein
MRDRLERALEIAMQTALDEAVHAVIPERHSTVKFATIKTLLVHITQEIG